MKILFTGKGTSGSWQIRGVQLGEAIGATVIPNATLADMRTHDVVVLVKRPTQQLLDDASRSGARLVHDIVDAWPQPIGNTWDEKTAKRWLRTTVDHVNADGVICATKAMERDVEHAVKCTIYHHAEPSLKRHRNLPMSHDYTPDVVYVGGRNYLGRYAGEIARLCKQMHWACNLDGDIDALRTADVAIALRDTTGYQPRHHKSNVKLANAQALGIPALCSPESGYQETSTGGVLWIDSPADLRAAFDALADPAHYAKVCAAVDAPPTLADCARQYTAFLQRVMDGR